MSVPQTAQELFDQVATHLLTQNAKSIAYSSANDGVSCRYRGPNGLRCAIGIFIPDDQYEPWMEGEVVTTDLVWKATGLPSHLDTLARALQQVHDENPVEAWVGALRYVAFDFQLSTAALTTLIEEQAIARWNAGERY